MFEFHYTPRIEPSKALEDIKKDISFEPSLAIFFVAGKQENPELLKLDCNSISVPVEGIITPKGVWSKGILAMITDANASVRTFKGNPKDVVRTIEKSRKGSFNFLIYPLMLIKSRLTFIRVLLSLSRTRSLERASEIFEEIIYPMNTLLRPFRDSGKTALAMNVFPLEIGIGIPKIFLNGKPIGRSVLSVSLEGKLKCEFEDVYPERGKSFEETLEILSQELANVKRVKVTKKGLAIKEIDGKSVKDFLRENRIFMREELEKDLAQQKFFGATPYGIFFISKETYGSASLGILDYELRFYPSLFYSDIFFDEAIFGSEFIRGGPKKVIENIREADFSIIDHNFMLMFEERIVDIAKEIGGYGVFSSYPSFAGSTKRRLMSEVENRIHINSTLTMAFLNLT